jgi:hypothetical protein
MFGHILGIVFRLDLLSFVHSASASDCMFLQQAAIESNTLSVTLVDAEKKMHSNFGKNPFEASSFM